jgi:hypothetical protein
MNLIRMRLRPLTVAAMPIPDVTDAKAESGDSKQRRWWGDLYELCPDALLDELNGEADYQKITALLKRYRAQKR